ncbi:hypothetical protein [Pseudoduganella armeniaca]|uniref:hypothetical protein n=1 Tax=Pseudoduganella armeniaca TaxID=2072590 RepID=UPI001E579D9C|nr:hypothetical protein [Pseudoduganella armeniaca]
MANIVYFFGRTTFRRLAFSALTLVVTMAIALLLTLLTGPTDANQLTDGAIMSRFIAMPAVLATCAYFLAGLTGSAQARSSAPAAELTSREAAKPYMAQVVGLQWLNPLQRRDYPTEWQLLWTLGLARPNPDDDMVKSKPERFGKLQPIGVIAFGNNGEESFEGYHEKYVEELLYRFRDIYFKSSTYFYNAHSTKDRTTWRELAGIRVQYAIPGSRLNPVGAAKFMSDSIRKYFDIGNVNAPNSWTRSTPPDVHVTPGGLMRASSHWLPDWNTFRLIPRKPFGS